MSKVMKLLVDDSDGSEERHSEQSAESETALKIEPQSQPQIQRPPSISSKPTLGPFDKLSVPLSKAKNHFRKRCPQFSNLPVELRLLIWEFALPDGRVHELHPCSKLLEHGKMMFRSNHSKPPVILSVCKESRRIALQRLQLMTYRAPTDTKGIRQFYYNPDRDTLFLNTLMGLYMAFMLLETDTNGSNDVEQRGVMKGWQNIAMDADRAHLLDLLAGHHGHPAAPRLRYIFPDLRKFTIAFDITRTGKTRFRTSVWPGENGTSLKVLPSALGTEYLSRLFEPMVQFTILEYGSNSGRSEGHEAVIRPVPKVELARVQRKRFLRGDIRYGFRKSCHFLHIRPSGIFMRL